MHTAQTNSESTDSQKLGFERRSRIAVSLALVIIPLIYFYPVFSEGILLAPGDGWDQIYGIRILIGDMLRHGYVPLWNPFIFGGMPLLASLQPGALYPPTWLFAILVPKLAMNVMVITTYHLALIGTYLFARRIGCNRVGSLLAGIGFTFGGYMIAHLGHTNRVAAAAWLPWILLAIEELYLRARWRWVTFGAIFIALQTYAGEPQMSFYTALVALPYAGLSLLFRSASAQRPRVIWALFVMGLCGALLSLIQLLPARELLAQGERASITYEYFSQYSFPPRQWAALFFPYFFGGAPFRPYLGAYWGEWNLSETTGCIGQVIWWLALSALLLIKIVPAQRKQVLFWIGIAALALFLSFGSHLPWNLHSKLFNTPIYNLFRAQGRHLFEFNFALSILSGLALTALGQLTRTTAIRYLVGSGMILAAALAAGTILYTFHPALVAGGNVVPPEVGKISNPDIYTPLVLYGFSLIGLALYAVRPRLGGVVLVAVLLVDAMSWGGSYEWRRNEFSPDSAFIDSPAIQEIKKREPNLNTFRILSHGRDLLGENDVLLDSGNTSIQRKLQTLHGYDPLRLLRLAEMSGWMSLGGGVLETYAFSAPHKGFDLLNVKYLLHEKTVSEEAGKRIQLAGVEFAETPVDFDFNEGGQAKLIAQGMATELVLISAMGDSGQVKDGDVVLRLVLRTKSGETIQRELWAGTHTSEWAYDREDVRATIKHKRAEIAQSWSAGNYEGHHYVARFTLPRAEIDSIEISHTGTPANITLHYASLFDAQTHNSTPITQLALPGERWRKIQDVAGVELYENLHCMPRAWFVNRAAIMSKQEVLRTIKTGSLPDGSAFSPAEVALFEHEDFDDRPPILPSIGNSSNRDVTVVRYNSQRISLQTNNDQAGFLVLSEMYYRGWEALIDGVRAPVQRVNYSLRGVAVPPGNHRITFVFRAHSFRTGVAYAGLGLLILLLSAFVANYSSGLWFRQRAGQDGIERSAEQSAWSRFFVSSWWPQLVKPALLSGWLAHWEIILIALLGLASLRLIYTNELANQPIRSDGTGYYLYLPGILLYQTIRLEVPARAQYGEAFEAETGLRPFRENGRYINRYAPGQALLMSPFFMLGHLGAWLIRVERNGFSWPYQWAAALSGWFYVVAGLVLLKLCLRRYFTPRTVRLTIIAIAFATNLFHYATFDNIFSHAYSFFLFSALLHLSLAWHASPSWRNTVLLGLVAGLITLVRPTNSLFLFLIPLLGLDSWESLKLRVVWIKQHLRQSLFMTGLYVLTVFPLLLYWKLITNHWIVDPYQDVPFFWANPQLANVLFSVRKGLFFWSPILLFAVAGWAVMGRYWKGFAVPAALCLLGQIYLVASWGSWSFGGSFGHRAFTETLVVFAVGYASFSDRVYQISSQLWRVFVIVSMLCALLSLKLMWQYWHHIIPYDETTWQLFISTFWQLTK
jgi:Bacterial membrane protein YfhO